MKNRFCFIFVVVMGFLFSSCDYVTVPYPKNRSASSTGPAFVKKVLLEDYTAQQCIYCPRAAVAAELLRTNNPGKVITIGVHVGSLAAPSGPPYNYDFRTPSGDNFDTYFQLSTGGLPTGMVDRASSFPTPGVSQDYNSWQSDVAQRLALPCSAFLTITNGYNSGNRQLTTTIKIKFLTALSGSYRLAVLLTEDSIVKPQKNVDSINHPPGNTTGLVSNYVHHHVLRDAINSGVGWGTLLTLPHTPTISGDSLVLSLTPYTIPVQFPAINGIPCNENRCSVVAFIYDDVTKEILQAEEKKVK